MCDPVCSVDIAEWSDSKAVEAFKASGLLLRGLLSCFPKLCPYNEAGVHCVCFGANVEGRGGQLLVLRVAWILSA